MNRETLLLKATQKTGLHKVKVKLIIVVIEVQMKQSLVVKFCKIPKILKIKFI
jgi:hypothetical protein